MRKICLLLVFALFVAFAVCAGQGHKAAAAGCLLAGFLLGAVLTGTPSAADRQAAREREQAARNAENLTRIY